MVGMVIVILFIAMMVISMVASPSENYDGEYNYYDEELLQDYADARYAEEFGDSSAYEDNLLLVFLTSEDYYDYAYIAWVGDHIDTDINYLFGDSDTELGAAMDQCINATNYKYSLDSDLANVMRYMTEQVKELGLDSSFYCNEGQSAVAVVAHFVNHTELPLTEQTVDDALVEFANTTGISVAIVVDEMEDVFSTSVATKTESSGNFVVVIAVVALLAVAVVLIVKAVKGRKEDDGYDHY